MILWIALFLLVIAISFILAILSMRDYQEIPQQSKLEYSLFLIRQTQNFNVNFLDSLHKLMVGKGLIISIERLFKGKKAALTIFGPREILDQFKSNLGLLELEDYTFELDSQDISVWEVGVKNHNFNSANLNTISELSLLEEDDQFFWQVVLGPKGHKEDSFKTQVRAAVYAKDQAKRKSLSAIYQNLKIGNLVKIPIPHGAEQMMNFYRLRSLSKESKGPVVDFLGVISLLKV